MNSEGENKIDRPISPKPISYNSISRLKHFIFKNLIFIIIIGIIGGFLGIIYATYQPIKYESSLTFALDEGTNSGSPGVFGVGQSSVAGKVAKTFTCTAGDPGLGLLPPADYTR